MTNRDETGNEWVKLEFMGHVVWGINGPAGIPIAFAPSLSMSLGITHGAFVLMSHGTLPECVMDRFRPRLERPYDVPQDVPANAFHLALGMTTDCSLRCSYCHAEADRPLIADEGIIMSAVRHAFMSAGHTARKTLSVSFAVGGEPTLPWELFQKTVKTLKDPSHAIANGVEKIFLSMTTNGFYGVGKRQYVADHFDHLTLSCDGPPDIQDHQRPSRSGEPSYRTVADSIRHFLNAASKPLVGIRATVTDLGVGRMPEIVRHFVSEFGSGIGIAFEPMVPIGRGGFPECRHRAPEPAAFTAGFLAALKEAESLGAKVHTSGPVLKRLRKHYCGAMAIPSFAVCVNGKVTACHRDQNASDYGYGQVFLNGRVEINEAAKGCIAKHSSLPDACVACFAVQNCAGGCPDARRFGQLKCDLGRTLLHRDLSEMVLNGKGGDGHGCVR